MNTEAMKMGMRKLDNNIQTVRWDGRNRKETTARKKTKFRNKRAYNKFLEKASIWMK